MRRFGLVAGIVLLIAGFTAAWFALRPDDSNHSETLARNDAVAALPGDQPLPSNTNGEGEGVPQADPLNPPGTLDGKNGPGEVSDTNPETRPDPSRIEATPGTKPGVENPPETGQGEKPPQAGGETSPPDAGETPALRPFIKGYPRPKGQNLGNTRPGARRVHKPTGVKELSEVTPKLMQDRRGLYAQYFQLDSPDVSKLDTSNPDMVRIDQTVYFPDAESFADLPISLENFAASWTGFLVIPAQGDYWLFWGADNGGRVELDGETVLLQDGMVRYVEVSTVLTLEPGLHPLKIEFAQTHNNVADWAKCAANFMYVPEGQTKPIPVPPEMLMVPEWMWHENPPIVTSVSPSSGEIGDEITIRGQALHERIPRENVKEDFEMYVSFAGQRAPIVSQTNTEIRVRVPIGAKSGDMIVYLWQIWDTDSRPVPSNSIKFQVTTQFGLMAEWHSLEGWENFDFVDSSQHEPDAVRIEEAFQFDSREGISPEFRADPFSCRWEGKLGLPKSWIPEDKSAFIEFQSRGKLRVTLDGETKEPPIATDNGDATQVVRFELSGGEEAYHSLKVEVADWAGQAALRVVELAFVAYEWPSENEKGAAVYEESRVLPVHWFFPPIVPPSPPVISGVEPGWEEGEQPAIPPYNADATRPSIRVGQEFTFSVHDEGPTEIWDSLPTVTVDGVPIEYTVSMDMQDEPNGEDTGEGSRTLSCRATMPHGVGEGRMVARLSIVSSEPFYIDIANRGLVAYLYDVPEGSGVNELPDIQPLTCFKIRKDRSINFEDTADFDLPFPAETFVIEWLGGLIIEQEGDYEFICRSDDGMKLWLDDNVVIDANHRQAPAENKATVHLVPGVYRFRMQFFENNQHEVCVLEWRATQGIGEQQAEIIPREVIPASAFSLDIHPPFPDKTSTGKRTDGS